MPAQWIKIHPRSPSREVAGTDILQASGRKTRSPSLKGQELDWPQTALQRHQEQGDRSSLGHSEDKCAPTESYSSHTTGARGLTCGVCPQPFQKVRGCAPPGGGGKPRTTWGTGRTGSHSRGARTPGRWARRGRGPRGALGRGNGQIEASLLCFLNKWNQCALP